MAHPNEKADWQARSPVSFVCEKRPVSAAGGMIVTNHPLASAAGAEIMLAGGNAIDAAVAALFALTVVEPMMVGIAGGGVAHLRLADGRHVILDALGAAPLAALPDSFVPLAEAGPDAMQVEGRRNQVGGAAVATPGNLPAWCEMADRYGTMPLPDLLAPAIRLARRGFRISHYLAGAVAETAPDLMADDEIARLLMPDGAPLPAGARLVMADYAQSLELIAAEGAAALHGGALGRALADRVQALNGFLHRHDLTSYATATRPPVVGTYRGHTILGPPPPASSGVHIVQMLNILEGFDVAGLGFGTEAALQLLVRVMEIAFADRRAHSGDPAFVDVPVDRLTSKEYAAQCRLELQAGRRAAAGQAEESANTTHLTVADREGNVVAATHTINSLFGARFMVPGTGIIPNNYMGNFDPHPGRALSIVPGKRVPTSMAPMMVLAEGRPRFALGLPGGTRIFTSALQAILNLIDHGMTPQEAVEAPRAWTEGHAVELEAPLGEAAAALRAAGHEVNVLPHVAGGMGLIAFEPDGAMTGAACWRADGTAVGVGGGPARRGVRFWPDRAPPATEEGEPT